jgi:hypothetical protein
LRRDPSRRGRTALVAALVALSVALTAIIVIELALPSPAINRALDRRALRYMANVARRAASGPMTLPFATAADLESWTRPKRPLHVELRPLPHGRHRRDRGLTQEEMTFSSAIQVRHRESNLVHAYVYRHGRLGDRPVVLWVPGLYVVELAFVPIGWFLDEILSRDMDVVFYVPPYHLERTPAGFASGDALLATDLPDHFAALAQELSDVRALAAWLRAQGPPLLGGFGGSLGGTMLLRMATWDDTLDFLTVMMPPLRLADVLLARPEAAAVRARLLGEGRTLGEIAAGYGAFDASHERPLLPPERISVLQGRFDLLAPQAALLEWARRWNIAEVHSYPRGHALMLFNRSMYRDYGRLLETRLGHGDAFLAPPPACF